MMKTLSIFFLAYGVVLLLGAFDALTGQIVSILSGVLFVGLGLALLSKKGK